MATYFRVEHGQHGVTVEADSHEYALMSAAGWLAGARSAETVSCDTGEVIAWARRVYGEPWYVRQPVAP